MHIEQKFWSPEKGWKDGPPVRLNNTAQLVFAFAGTSVLKDTKIIQEIKSLYPKAHVLGCSTAGEIFETQVSDDSLSLTAVEFEKTQISGTCMEIQNMEDSRETGRKLVDSINTQDLAHVFVLSEGINVNGSELVKGVTEALPSNVTVTGGLSGDGERFQETFVWWDDVPRKNHIALLGFYGSHLKIGYGSLGGWDSFGAERVITRSSGNVLYELDNQSALSLYKKYLGEHAKELPASGLLFPLSLRTPDGKDWVVRTILAVDEKQDSLIFAGDVPQGSRARLMKANFDRLIDGAFEAAKGSYEAMGSVPPDLAVLISCVGRKMVLKQRIEEEVEMVREVFGEDTILTGFYSYGEISPFTPDARCALHNQTMTITTFSER